MDLQTIPKLLNESENAISRKRSGFNINLP